MPGSTNSISLAEPSKIEQQYREKYQSVCWIKKKLLDVNIEFEYYRV